MITTRLLTADDMPSVEAVVRSRATWLSGGLQLDQDLVIGAIASRLGNKTAIMGLFEDGELDAFFEWGPIGLVPRADDARRYDAGALVHTQWSRARAGGRDKLDSGHDINAGHLLNAAISAMDGQGLFTYWYLTPAAWMTTPQRTNPLHAEMAAKRIARVAGLVHPGGGVEGDYAGFIKRRLMAPGGPPIEMAGHVSTLMDEHRGA